MIFLLLVAGAALLVAGAEILVRSASRLAAAAGVTPLAIGLTVVAFGTSAPELAVSLDATVSGRAGIATGNVVGSNIFNILFILGISALIGPLAVQKQIVRFELPIMVLASVALLVVAANGVIGRGEAIALFTALVVWIIYLARSGSRQGGRPDGRDDAVPVAELRRPRAVAAALAVSLVGLVLLVVGSRFFVHGAVSLARTLGVSEIVIGLTVIAAGTSLPEVATSVLASIRGERDIAVGNVVGSNIFNILAILGLCGAVAPGGLAVDASMVRFDIPVMIAVAVLALPILFTGMRITRLEGLLFLGCYSAYTMYLVLRATQHDALHEFSRGLLLVGLPALLLFGLIAAVQARRRPRAHR